MRPLLTIAIPVYNGKDRIHIPLNSILSQFDDRVEIIVSDNCSSDGTEQYVKENYPQVTYYKNEKNVGMENFQRCYKRSNGRFMLLLGDDDVLTEGSLGKILDFLDGNQDLKILFLNHTSFTGDYCGVEKCKPCFFNKNIGDFITTDKDRFIQVARHQLTFISCFILSKDAYEKIDNPDQYNDNWFLQTIIAFNVTEDKNSKLGILSNVCIAKNSTQNNAAANMDFHMDVFGVCESEIFCTIAPIYGYNKTLTENIYRDFVCSSWPMVLLGYKAKGFEWKKAFWEKGFPIIKKYPKAWITIIPAAVVPDCIAKAARNVKLKIKK